MGPVRVQDQFQRNLVSWLFFSPPGEALCANLALSVKRGRMKKIVREIKDGGTSALRGIAV